MVLAADPLSRPSVYEEGGLVVYRASAVGGCARALTAERLGFAPLPFNEDTLTVFREGHRHEDHVLEDLREMGWEFTGQQDEVEVKVLPHVLIRGHLDAMGRPPAEAEEVVVEVKALGASSFKTFIRHGISAFPRYGVQLGIYMHASDRRGALAVKNRNSGQIVIVRFERPPVAISEVRAKVARVEGRARSGDMLDCDTEARWNCQFLYLHDDPGEVIAESDIDAGTSATLEVLAEAYDTARDRLKQAQTVKDEARSRLSAAMASAELNKARAGRFQIGRSTRKQRRLDMDALRAAVDVKPFEKETTSEVVTVRDLTAGKES